MEKGILNMGKPKADTQKMAVNGQAKQAAMPQHFKKGGAVKHDDVAQDKKLIRQMIKQEDRKEKPGFACGGKVKMAAGGVAKIRHNQATPAGAPGNKVAKGKMALI